MTGSGWWSQGFPGSFTGSAEDLAEPCDCHEEVAELDVTPPHAVAPKGLELVAHRVAVQQAQAPQELAAVDDAVLVLVEGAEDTARGDAVLHPNALHDAVEAIHVHLRPRWDDLPM